MDAAAGHNALVRPSFGAGVASAKYLAAASLNRSAADLARKHQDPTGSRTASSNSEKYFSLLGDVEQIDRNVAKFLVKEFDVDFLRSQGWNSEGQS